MGGYVKYTGQCGYHGCHFIHHHGGYHHGRHGLEHCEGEMIGQIPVLRYLKDPVRRLEDLYKAFPLGGQPGDFAFVYKAHCFAYWHQGENKWKLITLAFTSADLIRNLGLRLDRMRDGHVFMWSEDAGGFVLYAIRTVTDVPVTGDLDGLYLVVGKGVWTVESGVVKEIVSAATWSSLTGKPTVDEFQTNWNETDNTKLSFLKNKPAINNSVIKIFQGEILKGFFSLNQETDKSILLEEPAPGQVVGDGFSGITFAYNGTTVKTGAYTLKAHDPDVTGLSLPLPTNIHYFESVYRIYKSGGFSLSVGGVVDWSYVVDELEITINGNMESHPLVKAISGVAPTLGEIAFSPYFYFRYDGTKYICKE